MEYLSPSELRKFRLDQAQRIAHVGSWEMDAATGISVWSDEACRIYGLDVKENEHTYEDWESFVHPDDLATVQGVMANARLQVAPFNFHYRIVRRDGTERSLYSTVEYQLDKQGVPIGLYGATHDITEIIGISNELSKSDNNLRLILDLIPLSIYARQANGDYIFANHVFLDHYGITEEGLRGKNIKDFVRSDAELDELSTQDHLVLTSGKKLIVSEFRQTDHNGVMKIWRIIKIPFTPRGLQAKAILGIAEDITTSKQHEESIIEMSKAIMARNNELEKFSMMVSHDLRGPLSTIMGVSNVIDDVKLTQDDLSFFVSGIRESLVKLDNIVRLLNEITGNKDDSKAGNK